MPDVNAEASQMIFDAGNVPSCWWMLFSYESDIVRLSSVIITSGVTREFDSTNWSFWQRAEFTKSHLSMLALHDASVSVWGEMSSVARCDSYRRASRPVGLP